MRGSPQTEISSGCSRRRKNGRDACASRPLSLSTSGRSDLQDALGMLFVGVDARLHFVKHGLVHDKLAVVTERDLETVHRARRRSFEIKPADVIARAMAGALELLFRFEPSRSASQMGAFGE